MPSNFAYAQNTSQAFVSSRLTGACIVALLHILLVGAFIFGTNFVKLGEIESVETTVSVISERQKLQPDPVPELKIDSSRIVPIATPPEIRIAKDRSQSITLPRIVGPVFNGSDDTPPKGQKLSKPPYPPRARRAKAEGVVRLELLVSIHGQVKSVRLIETSGYSLLDDSALHHAARAWRFTPARRAGRAIEVWHEMSVVFSLVD